jgi:hypothetical protein
LGVYVDRSDGRDGSVVAGFLRGANIIQCDRNLPPKYVKIKSIAMNKFDLFLIKEIKLRFLFGYGSGGRRHQCAFRRLVFALELVAHLLERHPFHSFVLVDIFDNSV